MKNDYLNNLEWVQSNLEESQNKLIDYGSWSDFSMWLDKPGNKAYQSKGIKKTTITNIITDCRRERNKFQKGSTPSQKLILQLETFKQKTHSFKQAVRDYTATPIEPRDPFSVNKTWFVYFFHLPTREKEPALGRAVLQTHSQDEVELENLPGKSHKNYTKGKYDIVYNQVCFFDLETRNHDRKLHIKVYYSIPEKDEILLGSYITYENNSITRGSIILEPATGEDTTPKLLSPKHNPETFKRTSLVIRKYLSLRKYNYYNTPAKIHSYQDLELFLHNHREDWQSRFIDEDIPNIFIASPGLSINQEQFEGNTSALNYLIQRLQKRFLSSEGINIRIHKARNDSRDIFPKTLHVIRNTSFFVLIFTKTNTGSYALVQLGWALAHCKVVMLFYQEGSISDHIRWDVPPRVQVQSFSNLEKGIDNIYNAIELQISRSYYI